MVESKNPIETYHITWSPDMKYLTFTRGPKFKGKNLKGLLPEFPGVEAPGWNVCVADATQKNRWVAIHQRRQVVQAAELRVRQGEVDAMRRGPSCRQAALERPACSPDRRWALS